jgi:hypothetical protein
VLNSNSSRGAASTKSTIISPRVEIASHRKVENPIKKYRGAKNMKFQKSLNGESPLVMQRMFRNIDDEKMLKMIVKESKNRMRGEDLSLK